MKLAPIDVAHRTFTRKMMGLDPHEVYNFLRDVADQMEEVVRERDRLQMDIRKKDSSLNDLEERDESLRATIQAASKMSEQFRKDAEREAQLILSDARQRAEVMVQDARDSLKRMYHEIADLKKTRMQFETGLKTLMEAHLTMLEQGRHIFPNPVVEPKVTAPQAGPMAPSLNDDDEDSDVYTPAHLSGNV